ncbi:MAG: UDP-N-acetylmuramoyl-L-alanine--D-glutamate ligase [Oscillospiraceae bacterium]|nr:UDP-N-acetylmuramoyl-L-alanine--D-glutamate ligase [Oscillospiraceae bacterium]
MDSRITCFFDSIQDKRIAFCGVGVSNTPLIAQFVAKGARVLACDRRGREELGPIADALEAAGARLRLGDAYLDKLDADIIFRTPGMYFHLPALTEARERGVIVTSEMEVFAALCPCPVIAVTGSDGKTTTSTLIARMLEAQGRRVHLGGNIGRALLPVIEEIAPGDIAVAELSSFQLISMRAGFDVAVVTNLTPNHLDVHGSMEEYIEAKRHVFRHQNAFSKTVLNFDNAVTRGFADEVRGEPRWFSRGGEVARGAFLRPDGMLCLKTGTDITPLLHKSEIKLPGEHNVENYLAAIAAVYDLVTPGAIKEVAREFGGVEHRIELVAEKGGVRWYNDSIATSPTRTVAGLRSFGQKIILLAGGYDKQIPFEPLAEAAVDRVRLLILTGPTAPAIEAAVRAHPAYDPSAMETLHASGLPEAVGLAQKMAAPGDIVMLSPACASFDAYPNFEARGRHFKELVASL